MWNSPDLFPWISDGSKVYDTTIGNNAIAQIGHEDLSTPTDDDYRPVSAKHKFTYPYDPSLPAENQRDAAITQAFYIVNMYHDLLYELGFKEKDGNFQTNNGDKGGIGNDPMVVDVQKPGAKNNAHFVHFGPEDGGKCRIELDLWDYPDPERDGAFEMYLLIHEYTHGLTMRLVNPKDRDCLGPGKVGDSKFLNEGFGLDEGWSEFMSFALRIKKGDTRNTVYATFPYVNPGKVGTTPWTIDRQVNKLTLEDLNRLTEEHDQGHVWSTVLFEVLWNLVDKYGITDTLKPEFRPNDPNNVPTDGRFLAMKLVIEGMKLIQCSSSILHARDAFLQAEKTITNGENRCLVYEAFAFRGMGQNAVHEHFTDRKDGTFINGFEVPEECQDNRPTLPPSPPPPPHPSPFETRDRYCSFNESTGYYQIHTMDCKYRDHPDSIQTNPTHSTQSSPVTDAE